MVQWARPRETTSEQASEGAIKRKSKSRLKGWGPCLGLALRVPSQSRPIPASSASPHALSSPNHTRAFGPGPRAESRPRGWNHGGGRPTETLALGPRPPSALTHSPTLPPPRIRRLCHRHRLGGCTHVCDLDGWRGQVLGLQRQRPAGDREQDGSDEARGCARWERREGGGGGGCLSVCV
jgi:hypothetical protein